MASDKTISIGFKIEDGANGFKQLVVNADNLSKAMKSSVVEAEKLKGGIINFSALAKSVESVSAGLQSFQAGLSELTGAYAVQIEAETKLEQTMRNTMGARDEEIRQIKEFCSVQQQIGIVGDEVQLAGAQELATYLELKDSLKTLIPVMNDMVAQQYGLSHSSENAAQIATMLGKVMQGQTGALSRYGYTFDAAQEQILKFGTESERAAVLAQVVSASVGGMNEKLAQTDAGKMKQLQNTLGDIKEQMGGMARQIEPFLALGSNAVIASMGVIKLVKGLKALRTALFAANAAGGALTLAITAIATATAFLITSSDSASGSLAGLSSAQKRAKEASEAATAVAEAEADARRGALSSIQLNISRLKEFNGTKAEEKKLVSEMNSTYGRTMGYFKSVSGWYEALVANSKAYCAQMVLEAKTRKLADRIAEVSGKRDAVVRNPDGSTKKYSKKKHRNINTLGMSPGEITKAMKSDWELAQEAVYSYSAELAQLQGQMEQAVRQAGELAYTLRGADSPENPEDGESGSPQSVVVEKLLPEGSIAFLQEQIRKLDTQISLEVDPQSIAGLEVKKREIEDRLSEIRTTVRILTPDEEWERIKKLLEKDTIKVQCEVEVPENVAGSVVETLTPAEKLQQSLGAISSSAQAAGNALRGMGQAFEIPALDIAGMIAGAIATLIQSYAQAVLMASMVGGPFAWLGFGLSGLATLTGMITQIKSVAKFADGGIVSGPTMALVGEYAGATNNPEVIAPLDKLRDIIGTSGPSQVVVIGETRIKGSDIAISYRNYEKISGKSGRK